MPLSFLRRALRLKKSGTEKEFDDFLRVFENAESSLTAQLSKHFKRRVARFLVMRQDGNIIFDSSSDKESKELLFPNSRVKMKFIDCIFGGYGLSSCKDALFSTKVHDFSTNQILITRLLKNLEKCKRVHFFTKKVSHGFRQKTANIPPVVPTIPHDMIAALLIINLDWASGSSPPTLPITCPPSTILNRKFSLETRTSSPSPENNPVVRHSDIAPKRFHRMLFEHSAQISILVEALVRETLRAVFQRNRLCWPPGSPHHGCQCSTRISKAFDDFLEGFYDLCYPRLQYPVWSTLNNVYAMAYEKISPLRMIAGEQMKCASGYDLHTFLQMDAIGASSIFDSLANAFVRYCANPLLSRSGKDQVFLSQVITAVLILYPGWISTLVAYNSSITPEMSCTSSTDVSPPNWLLEQLLLQTGCSDTNLDALGGSIFNCTVLTGQSKKQLLALLFFITYFLRFPSLLYTCDTVPDLGNADLFQLETRKRHPGGNAQRNSGSAVICTRTEAHDSGISSQEDLPNSYVYPASTGSSPTHIFGTALCLPHRLTLDQCRIAEAAAQRVVIQENAENLKRASVQKGNGGINSTGSSRYARQTEIPLLFERCLQERDTVCMCLPLDPIPAHLPPCVDSFNSASIQTYSGLSSRTAAVNMAHLRGFSDSSPALNMSVAGTLGRTSPNSGSTKHSSFVAHHHQATYSSLTTGSLPGSFTRPAVDLSYRDLSPSITDHSLIGSAVMDRYCRGLVLQATTESLDTFRDRLEQQLSEWLSLGPLAIRGYGLSTNRLIDHDTSAVGPMDSSTRDLLTRASHTTTRWTASGLIVNMDNRTVEVLSMKQPFSDESPQLDDPCSSRISSGSRLSVASTTSADSNDTRLVPVQAAPLVTRLLEQVKLVFERTGCPTLALRSLEAGLLTIADKSRVLADLLTVTGVTVLKHRERMAAAACCSVKDLPLLLSTAATHNLALTVMLNNHLAEKLWIS